MHATADFSETKRQNIVPIKARIVHEGRVSRYAQDLGAKKALQYLNALLYLGHHFQGIAPNGKKDSERGLSRGGRRPSHRQEL